jgi:hypothetical protein
MNDKLSVMSFHLNDHIFIFIILVYFMVFFVGVGCWMSFMTPIGRKWCLNTKYGLVQT